MGPGPVTSKRRGNHVACAPMRSMWSRALATTLLVDQDGEPVLTLPATNLVLRRS